MRKKQETEGHKKEDGFVLIQTMLSTPLTTENVKIKQFGKKTVFTVNVSIQKKKKERQSK